MRPIAGSLVIPMVLACSQTGGTPPAPAPAQALVRVEGEAGDLRRLAGGWYGGFESEQHDRRGSIIFSLAVDSDTAYGSVTLEPPIRTPECVDPARPVPAVEETPIVLRVGGAATSAGSVGGWMQPYLDPASGCRVNTWFEGRLVRDTLQGTYFSRRAGAEPIRRGSWWAARRAR